MIMSLLLKDRVYTMQSSTAKRGVYPLHGYKLGLYRIPIKLDDPAEIKSVFEGMKDTFEMDMQLCDRLIPMIPNGKIIVAESGVSSRETIERLSSIGADAFFIGEHFMRQDNIGEEVQRLKNSPTELFKN